MELLSTDEILRAVFLYRSDELTDPYKRKGYITGLSVALHNLCKNGKLFSHSVKGVKGLYYGLPQWHEADGELKSYYEYELKIKTDRIINDKKSSFFRQQEYA